MSNDFPFKHFFTNPAPNTPNVKEIKLDELFSNKRNRPSAASLEPINKSFDDSDINMMQEEIHNQIKSMISTEKYNAYFNQNLKIIDIKEQEITFAVTTAFVKRVIEASYMNFIKTAIKDSLGKNYEVKINLLGETSQNNQKEETKVKSVKDVSFTLKDIEQPLNDELQYSKALIVDKPISNFRADKTKTFNNFVMGPSNNMAYAFALSVAKEPGKVYPSLFIYGNSGLGKTHLLHAIANYVEEKRPELRIMILSANTFMREMVTAISNNSIHDFRKRFSERVDLLIIDDIHELKNRKGTQNEFFNVFNELQNRGKQLIFTSDKHPKEITGIEDRIKTRLSSALSVEIQQPDLETRIAILKKKSMEKDLYLDDEVINLIARCIKTNIRELEGSLIKLGAYSSILNVDIDIEIAKEQLKLSEDMEQKVMNIDSISRTVANYFKLNLGDIRGKSRIKDITKARHIAMYLSHQLLKTTLQSIGEYFSHRDHTSVMHGIKKVKKEIKENQQITQTVYEIESQL